MSRNLCATECYFCRGRVVLEEAPRPIVEAEAGRYFDEYEGMLVANAHCYECRAKYLAWVDGSGRHGGTCGDRYPSSAGYADGQTFGDLSFRSTFNDEFGQDDLPDYQIVTVRTRQQWPRCTCGQKACDYGDRTLCLKHHLARERQS